MKVINVMVATICLIYAFMAYFKGDLSWQFSAFLAVFNIQMADLVSKK